MNDKSLDARVLDALVKVIQSGQPVTVRHKSLQLEITGGRYYPRVDELHGEEVHEPMYKN